MNISYGKITKTNYDAYTKRVKKEEKKAKWDSKCKSFTDAGGKYITDPVVRVFSFFGSCALFIWKMVKAFLNFFVVFFVHVWTLIVSGKKKACPYIMFKD